VEEPFNTGTLPSASIRAAMEVSYHTAVRIIGVILIALGLSNIAFAFSYGRPIVPYLGPAVGFIGLGIAAYAWALWKRPSQKPRPPSRFWITAAKVVGSLLLLVALLEGPIVSVFLGPGEGIASALIPWGILGTGLWGYALFAERALDRARAERLRIPSGVRDGTPVGQGALVPPVRDPHTDTQVRAVYQDTLEAVRASFEVSRPIIRRSSTLTVGCLTAVFLFLLFIVARSVNLPALPYFALATAVALPVVGLSTWAWWRRFAKLGEALKADKVPSEPFPNDAPILEFFRWLRELRGTSRPLPLPRPETSLLARSVSLLEVGQRLEKLARRSATSIFVLLLLGGMFGAYVASFILLVRLGGGTAFLSRDTLIAWGAALVAAGLSFAALHRMYRPLDLVGRSLDTLEEREVELERTFWTRY
jgi:hypothetical protein